MKDRWVRILLAMFLLVLFTGIAIGVYMWRSSLPGEAGVRCSTDSDGRLVFNVWTSRRVGEMSISVRQPDEMEPLWGVISGGGREWSITYGQTADHLRPTSPPHGTPIRGIPPGSVFCVVVNWTLRHYSPYGGYAEFWFQMTEDGVPKAIDPPITGDNRRRAGNWLPTE